MMNKYEIVGHQKNARTIEASQGHIINISIRDALGVLPDWLWPSWLLLLMLAALETNQNMNVDKQMENESKISSSEMPTNTTWTLLTSYMVLIEEIEMIRNKLVLVF